MSFSQIISYYKLDYSKFHFLTISLVGNIVSSFCNQYMWHSSVLYRGKLNTLTPFLKFSCFTKFRPIIKACTIHCHNLLVPHFATFAIWFSDSQFIRLFLPVFATECQCKFYATFSRSLLVSHFANLCQFLPL